MAFLDGSEGTEDMSIKVQLNDYENDCELFDADTYREFFEKMGIQAEYRLAKGLISCCVAVIKVKK
ncbi:MAG: hypothetical protein J6X53_08690 [Abditibacteriota bacterium]|nr:hypothetical protein [Abditibacteriota bacterium]